MVNGVNMTPLQSGLTINAIIVDNLPLAPNGLGLTGTTNPAASIILTGGGVLQLSGANTFSGGIDVQGGSSLIIGGSSTPTANGSTVTAGPVGTGTLTLENNASLLSTNAANTIANNVVFAADNGTYTFNGANSLTLTGTITLPDFLSIDVVNPGMTATLAGTITDRHVPICHRWPDHDHEIRFGHAGAQPELHRHGEFEQRRPVVLD